MIKYGACGAGRLYRAWRPRRMKLAPGSAPPTLVRWRTVMAPAPRTPDVVLTADWPVVQKAMRAIMRGVTTANGKLADERLERVTGELAGASARFADAAYLAVQILRDLGRLDESEAVYLLDAICDARMERFEDHDPEYQAILLARGPLEEHLAGMLQRRRALEAQ